MQNLPALLLAKKRDGHRLSDAEVADLVTGIVDGSLTDAQLGALLMAGLLRGADARETAAWTREMRDSGFVYDLSAVPGAKVDKHSTGGGGDSLVLAPLAASLGVIVPMVSGRGLGHTGGTIDKLESIPGFRTDLSPDEFEALLARLGVAMSAATDRLVPADRRMYAIRDVTATVESVSWITASILSKKLAEGIEALVLDVKCGRGAFMRDLDRARELAESIASTARELGCPCRARITDMDQPLGRAVGNSLEVVEAIECLRGHGPADLREVVVVLAADMVELAGRRREREQAVRACEEALDDGTALAKFRAMVEGQGGDPAVVDDPSRLGAAACIVPVAAEAGGFVADLDPFAIAVTAVKLGAGRRVPGEAIQPQVGIVCCKKRGEAVATGETLFEVHAKSAGDAETAVAELATVITIADAPPEPRPLLLAGMG